MITKETVLKVAELANLEIKEEKLEKYTKQLSDILNEIEKITNVEITEDEMLIAPTTKKDIKDFEGNKTEKSLSKDEIFKNAANHDHNYITVKRVVEWKIILILA